MRGGRGLVAQSSLALSHKSVLNGLQTFEHQELSPDAMQKALGLQLTRNQSKTLVWLHKAVLRGHTSVRPHFWSLVTKRTLNGPRARVAFRRAAFLNHSLHPNDNNHGMVNPLLPFPD